ncbi:hypothetical protein ACOSQ3_009707 [Xanthoceras sorbifolium]
MYDNSDGNGNDTCQFGPWLRAVAPVRGNNRKQKETESVYQEKGQNYVPRSEVVAVTINPLKEENVMSELLGDGGHGGIKCAIEANVKNVDVVEGEVVEMERGEVISDDMMVHLGLDVRYDGILLRSK